MTFRFFYNHLNDNYPIILSTIGSYVNLSTTLKSFILGIKIAMMSIKIIHSSKTSNCPNNSIASIKSFNKTSLSILSLD